MQKRASSAKRCRRAGHERRAAPFAIHEARSVELRSIAGLLRKSLDDVTRRLNDCARRYSAAGNAYATSESPILVPSEPCPPAITTTYWRPVFAETYVVGVAWPPAGRRASQSFSP